MRSKAFVGLAKALLSKQLRIVIYDAELKYSASGVSPTVSACSLKLAKRHLEQLKTKTTKLYLNCGKALSMI